MVAQDDSCYPFFKCYAPQLLIELRGHIVADYHNDGRLTRKGNRVAEILFFGGGKESLYRIYDPNSIFEYLHLQGEVFYRMTTGSPDEFYYSRLVVTENGIKGVTVVHRKTYREC